MQKDYGKDILSSNDGAHDKFLDTLEEELQSLADSYYLQQNI